jgi:uncharacterized membrane protein
MTLLTNLRLGLQTVVELLEFCLEAIATFCILLGLLSVVQLLLSKPKRLKSERFLNLRLRLGSWWALALEFQLGADILSTTIAPSFAELGKLGAIALIRTFLNYFLSQELLEEETRLNRNPLE